MNFNRACLLRVSSLLLLSTPLLQATDMTAAQAAQKESTDRHLAAFQAAQAVSDGEKLLRIAKNDEAADRFQYALDALTPGGSSDPLYRRAEAGLASAKAAQAQDLAKDSKFAQAASKLQEAINLQPNNPVYRQDLDSLKQQQIAFEEQSENPEGIVNNPAVTDEFKNRVAAAQKLLFQGDDYFKTGQFDRAETTYSKILILDPYNKAARDKMAHIERYKERAAEFRHEQYKNEKLYEVNHEWAEDVSTDIVVPQAVSTITTVSSNRANITRKLQGILIDKINFDKLDIATVIQFLTQKSKELDPEHVGINFVLNLNSEETPSPTPATPTGATTPAAGAPPAPAAGGRPGAPAAPEVQPIHRAVSITLDNVPLSDVLDYITQQTNLQFSVDDYAVYLRPSIDEGQTLSVRTFLAPPNFFSGTALKVTLGGGTAQPTSVEGVSANVQQELINRGIRFPAGATATFLPGSSKLVVRNTPEQLDLIANLIDQLSKETPQVEIEAKIAEFNEDALKSLSFNYELGFGSSLLPTGTTINGALTATSALRNANFNTSADVNGGLQPNSVDTLISQNTASNSGVVAGTNPITGATITPNLPNFLTIGAILDGKGFAAVIQAINNITGVQLVSAPSVTTQNGLKANIDIVREFPYPTSFEKPKLSNSLIAYSAGPSAGADLTLATPPTPREFVTQDVGVSLEVKPTTYPDQRIDLDITKAQVIDFDGFIDYGVPIVTLLAQDAPVSILTAGTINQPVFNVRSIVTRLQVLDGQTAVLGGLIREDTQEINDKVPVLGDLPLIGRLFQSKVNERTKKNLLIFVTARLIRSNGKPQYIRTLDAEPQEDKLLEPQPIEPGVNLPPLPEGQPNS